MKRLFVDVEKCESCSNCVVRCGYFYRPMDNNGITSLREIATFLLLCRRCEESPCVNVCHYNALKKGENGIIHRAKFLCTGCRSCSIACPFGVILPEFLEFLSSTCDYCLRREEILCVESCPYQAVEIKDVEEDKENDIYIVSDNLAVHSSKWVKDDTLISKK